MHRSRPGLPPFLVTLAFIATGCNTTANLIDGTAGLLGDKAKELRMAQVRFSNSLQERREKARQARCPDQCNDESHRDRTGKLCHHDGTLEETLETELKILLESGLEFSDYQLDFKKVQELAKEQARYDEEHEEAMKAWHEYEEENYRRHVKGEADKAKALAGSGNCISTCAPIIPNCAFPPPKEYAKSEPPKRKAIGLDEIPIVIHANAKLNVGSMSYGKSQVKRELVKGKQPCCPECGTTGCVDRCNACGFVPIKQFDAAGAVPPAPGTDMDMEPGQVPE